MMITLIDQLTSYHQATAREQALACALQNIRQSRREQGQKKRRPGLSEALRDRLPTAALEAMTMAEMRPLLFDVRYVDSALPATLKWLLDKGEISRLGSSGGYRYYRITASKGKS